MLDLVTQRIAELGGRIEGITTYRDPPPSNVTSDLLPLLYVLTGPSTDEDQDNPDYVYETRLYRVRVAVLTLDEATPEVRELRGRPLLDSLKRYYRSLPGLDHFNWVERARVLGDSGIILLPDYSEEFIGFEIQLEVKSIEARTYLE